MPRCKDGLDLTNLFLHILEIYDYVVKLRCTSCCGKYFCKSNYKQTIFNIKNIIFLKEYSAFRVSSIKRQRQARKRLHGSEEVTVKYAETI
jgi:hypothetical protein